MICDRDCFNCKFEDCVNDEITESEKKIAENAEIAEKNRLEYMKWVGVKGEKARYMRYKYGSSEKYKAKTRKASKKWKENHPEYKQPDRSAYFREYWAKKGGAV